MEKYKKEILANMRLQRFHAKRRMLKNHCQTKLRRILSGVEDENSEKKLRLNKNIPLPFEESSISRKIRASFENYSDLFC